MMVGGGEEDARAAAAEAEVGLQEAQLSSIVDRFNRAHAQSSTSFGLLDKLASEYGTQSCEEIKRCIEDDIKECCRIASDLKRSNDSSELVSNHPTVLLALRALYYASQSFSASIELSDVIKKGPVTLMPMEKKKKKKSKGGKGGKGEDGDDAHAEDIRMSLSSNMAKFVAMDASELNRIQELYLYLLNVANMLGYRRKNGVMYRAMFIEDELTGRKYNTHSWTHECTLSDFVRLNTRKETNYDMWCNVTCAHHNLGNAVDYLANCCDSELPILRSDRQVFSFENGVYFAGTDTFVRYGSKEHDAIPSHTIASKFFPISVGEDVLSAAAAASPMAIPTPYLQSILDFQDMSEETSYWLYVMLGRLLYNVGERDGWQVIPFLKGAGSTGKSTILTQICQRFYDVGDIGVLSNNIERKFGLSALYDKLMFIGPEIKRDIQLEQAEFQSIVSGEPVQVAIKYQDARSVQWSVPGILAGNQIPGWTDNSGSINRRILMFEFPNTVSNGDMCLGEKLQTEMGAILIKSNRCYLEAVAAYKTRNIWNVLPQALIDAKNELSENVNSIMSFLRSGELDFDKTYYVPYERLAMAYEDYVKRMGLVRIPLLKDNFNGPLLSHCCSIDKKKSLRMYPIGSTMALQTRYIIGCDFAKMDQSGGGDVVV